MSYYTLAYYIRAYLYFCVVNYDERTKQDYLYNRRAISMSFNKQYLETYKNLIQTTELQKGYQEFIKLFRFLKIELEKELTEFQFSGNIQENNMDFAYFQLMCDELKAKGIKIQIVFVHKAFRFEVWASGYNRKIQCEYYEKLKNTQLPYALNDNPNRVDYILKLPIDGSVDLSDGMAILNVIKENLLSFLDFVQAEL